MILFALSATSNLILILIVKEAKSWREEINTSEGKWTGPAKLKALDEGIQLKAFLPSVANWYQWQHVDLNTCVELNVQMKEAKTDSPALSNHCGWEV